jgi:hypothetical protein
MSFNNNYEYKDEIPMEDGIVPDIDDTKPIPTLMPKNEQFDASSDTLPDSIPKFGFMDTIKITNKNNIKKVTKLEDILIKIEKSFRLYLVFKKLNNYPAKIRMLNNHNMFKSELSVMDMMENYHKMPNSSYSDIERLIKKNRDMAVIIKSDIIRLKIAQKTGIPSSIKSGKSLYE